VGRIVLSSGATVTYQSFAAAWFTAVGSKMAHVGMEATGRHSLGVASALHSRRACVISRWANSP
jgi:hypothetical protein